MQWLRSQITTPCLACGLPIQPGERMSPVEGEAGALRYMHLSCAKASLPAGPSSVAPQAPVCKHWRSRGFCLFGERCVFRHPPECLEAAGQQQAQAPTEQADGMSATKRRGNQAGQRRTQPRNKFRAGAFRRFLLDTFGREKLGEGAGVLDVAGGKGEVGFELLNLNGLPATVLEPRPLELQRRVKWLQNGFYHWNAHHARYNDRQWISSSLEQQAAAAAAPEPAGTRHTAAGGPGSVLMPDHLRLVITPELAACLVGQAAGSSRESLPPGSPPPEWRQLFLQARLEARRDRWLKPAPPHERAAAAAGKHATEPGDGAKMPTTPSEPAAPSTPEPAAPTLAALATPPRRRAVAWTIPADSESEQEEAWWSRAADSSSSSDGANSSSGSLEPVGQPADDPGQQAMQQQQQQQEHAGEAAEPHEVEDAAEAWRRLAKCSVVVGMHPDQATEFVVDLAIAHGKPFAVVPCCVYPADFPRRTLCGRPVTSYEQFCEYLAAKDPGRIRVATLPFEGRNRVLYRLAP